jgi:hypothetical protein
LWSGHGYPRLLQPGAVAGQVIHATIRRLASMLAQAGCTSALDPEAASVLRGVGGLTVVLHEELARVLDRERDNPRVQATIARVRDELTCEVPAMRQHVQAQLQRMVLTPRVAGANGDGTSGGALPDGSYYELRLRASGVDFVGVVDLLTITHGQCTIWDFKTGAVSERHVEQLRVYALLWTEDPRNPTQKPPDRLVLSYEHHEQHVPSLSSDDVAALRGELSQRVRLATAALGTIPPPACPAPAHCAYCDVRQLCPEYWSALPTWEDGGAVSRWRDVEVDVGSARGPRSWDAILVRGVGVKRPSPIVLVHGNPVVENWLSAGVHVRLLGVHSSVVDGVTLVTMTAATQAFVLP